MFGKKKYKKGKYGDKLVDVSKMVDKEVKCAFKPLKVSKLKRRLR